MTDDSVSDATRLEVVEFFGGITRPPPIDSKDETVSKTYAAKPSKSVVSKKAKQTVGSLALRVILCAF